MAEDKLSYSEITLIRSTGTPLNPWELSTFIAEFSNHIYKLDLIRNIANLIKQGIKAENIIILDGTFRRKRLSQDVIDLTSKLQFQSFQSIGAPESLFPNENILKLGIIIKFYRSANALLTSNLSNETLTSSYSSIDNTDFVNIIDNLYKQAIEKARKQRNFQTIKNSLQNIKQEKINEYRSFISRLEPIKKDIANFYNNKDNTPMQTDDKYFKSYFELFLKIKKPIVGVYDHKNKKVKIVCSSYLKKSKKNEKLFLDFKRIEHNSPQVFDITVLADIAKGMLDGYFTKKVADEQIKTEKEKQKTEQITQEYWETKIRVENEKLDLMKQKREQLIDITETDPKSISEHIQDIPIKHIQYEANRAYSVQSAGFMKTLKNNKLDLTSVNGSKLDQKV